MNSSHIPINGGVLVLCRLRDEEYLKVVLNDKAHEGWEDSGRVHLLSIEGRFFSDSERVKVEIKNFIKTNRKYSFHVFMYRQSKHKIDFFFDSPRERWEMVYVGINKEIIESKIHNRLRHLGLDWFSPVAGILKDGWIRDPISEDRIIKWMKQFEYINKEYGWIGKNLLKTLEFWPENKIINSLLIKPNDLENIDKICLSTEKPGKSADVLCNLVSKHLKKYPGSSPEIVTPSEGLNNPDTINVLWIEDFLLSATEATSLIKSLLGDVPKNRSPKTNPLDNPKFLFNKHLQFRYALETDFGHIMLDMLFEKNNLDKCEISTFKSLNVLTTDGEDALRDGDFFDKEDDKLINNPEKYLKLHAFSNKKIWSTQQQKEATIFCKKIGEQLFKNYVDDQVNKGNWTRWSDERIKQCAFGKNHLGLALAFGHTVPKASLPLFWWRGKVKIKGKKEINWMPLFPSTD